jgi:hypothetical protein
MLTINNGNTFNQVTCRSHRWNRRVEEAKQKKNGLEIDNFGG